MTKPDAEVPEIMFDPDETVRFAAPVPSWGYIVFGFVVGLLMLAGGMWMVAEGEGFEGWLVFAVGPFLLVCSFIVVRRRFNPERQEEVTLSPEGLAFKVVTGGRAIPWADVTGLQLSRVGMVGIGLSDNGRAMLQRNVAMNALGKHSERFTGPGDIAVTPNVVPLPSNVFHAVLLTYVEAHTDSPWAEKTLGKIEAGSVLN